MDDVKTIVDKMEKGVRFRINAAKDNEVIKRLYDTNRGKLLFALPPKVKSVSVVRSQVGIGCKYGGDNRTGGQKD